MSCTVIVGHNPLDRSSWQRHEKIEDFGQFLLDKVAPEYNGHFPSSGRIYLENIDDEHDITPGTPAAAEALRRLEGTVYVMVWPKDPASAAIVAGIVINLAVAFFASKIKDALTDKPETAAIRRIPAGSPNNIPGARRNQARVNERIPDIFGRVRSTPDLISVPVVTYENNLQSELSTMCIGIGQYNVFDHEVFEGDTQVKQLSGTSVEVYPPGELPGGGTPQLTIGDAIADGLYTIFPVENVKGDVLTAPNQNALYSDDVLVWSKQGNVDPTYDFVTAEIAGGSGGSCLVFSYPSAGVGTITIEINFTSSHPGGEVIPNTIGASMITDRFQIGTKFGLEWNEAGITVVKKELITAIATAPNLRLMPETEDDDHYEITNITVTETPSFLDTDTVVLEFTVPASVQSEWALIAAYGAAGVVEGGDIDVNSVGNHCSIVYPLPRRIGPFFVNDPDREFFRFNFTADTGLWVDDGKKQLAFPGGVTLTAEFTPADEDGNPDGPKETHDFTLTGDRYSRSFIGQTFDYTPSFPGRALVAVYRSSNTPNRHQSNSWESFNASWLLGPFIRLKPWDGVTESEQFAGTFSDEVKWTHCYSMSTVDATSFGDVTLVHSKVSQRKNQAPETTDRRLNMIVNRLIPLWDGAELLPETFTRASRDAIFEILRSRALGNLSDDSIDFDSISAAHDAVSAALGPEAVFFDHTFDSGNASTEDLLDAVGSSCFMKLYRQGDVVKATPDVSTQNATVLFNHRNKIPGSETRSVTFLTEEEYDGVQVSYHNDSNERVETFTAPNAGTSINPKIVQIAGVHTRAKAMMHAWRIYNQLQYQNTFVEFDSCEEALVSIVNDKVMVSDNTRTDTQDGDIVEVDGLTLRTSQQLSIGGADSTIFIQHIDGTTEPIAIDTQDTPNSLTLATAPSQTIFIDEDNNIYPRYIITRNTTTIPAAYRVDSRQYKSPGVFSVTASNYTEGVYFFDAIVLWLQFESTIGYSTLGPFLDRSPIETDCEAVNGATTAFDTERAKTVYSGVSAVSAVEIEARVLSSYTIACWIKKQDNTDPAFIAESSGSTDLVFFVEATTNDVKVQHGGVTYVEDSLTIGVWTHLAVVYDADAEEMFLYKNGELVDTATAVPQTFTSDPMTVLRSLEGNADDLRIYKRTKSPDFIRTLYQKTRVV